MHHRTWSLVLATVAVLLGWAMPVPPAGAHAVPAAMDPAPDARLDVSTSAVVIRFTERVEARASSLEVLDAFGRRIDRGQAAVDPADPWRFRVALPFLPPGAYTVSWRVLSADDGHVTSGGYVFTVGTLGRTTGQSGPTVRSGVGGRPLARWLIATGGALLLGALLAIPVLDLGATRWIRSAEGLGMVAVAAGGTLDLVLQAHELAGGRPTIRMLARLLFTPPGLVWLVRTGLLVLLVVRSRASGSRRGWGPQWVRVPLIAAVVMIGGLVSHGAAVVEGRWVALGAEALHLLAVASWVGGLFAFATVFWRVEVAGAPGPDTARLALAVPTFSRLAVVAVGILAVTGLLLARLHLTAWNELIGTEYGRWLLAKLVVFAGMLVLGAWHQGSVEPRLAHALAKGDAAESMVVAFRRSVRIEAGLGLVALGLAGVLGVTAPPSAPGRGAPPPFRHERTLDEARVRLEITPLRPGPNRMRLTVTDPAGQPLADATAALVQLTPTHASVGAVTFQLDRVAPGLFVAPSAVLGLIGRWDGRLVVQRLNAYDVNDRFEVVITDGLEAHAHDVPAASASRSVSLDRVTVGATVTVGIVALALFLRSRRRLETVRRLLAETPERPARAPAQR